MKDPSDLHSTELLRRERAHLTVNELPCSQRKFLPDTNRQGQAEVSHAAWVQLSA